ncbi:hypothetical protein V2W45_1224933, partial [Cenococcum geophilum]
KTFPCNFRDCPAFFIRLADLQAHQSIVHSAEKPFPYYVENCNSIGERGFSR